MVVPESYYYGSSGCQKITVEKRRRIFDQPLFQHTTCIYVLAYGGEICKQVVAVLVYGR